jgi:spore maturation protein CgeB
LEAPLKIVIFGLTLTSSWGNGHATPYRAILRALHRRGHRIIFYEKDVQYYELRRDFQDCDYCDLILYREWDEIRPRAIDDVRNADTVINASYCPDGARIIDEVADAVSGLHLFYDLDTPITLANLAGGSAEYLRRDQIPHFDVYLSFTGGKILQELEQHWGARCARPLYGCVDPEVYRRVPREQGFRCLLSYMGTHATDRQEKLNHLFLEAARQLPSKQFILAGSLYPREWKWPANVRHLDHVAPAQHPTLYSSSSFTLNLTRGDMARRGYCPSGRFFEAAACGTPIISDWFDGLDSFFKPGKEIAVAIEPQQVLSILRMPEQDRATMAWRARARTLAEHTGNRRAEQLLGYLQEAASRKRRSRARLIGMEAAS